MYLRTYVRIYVCMYVCMYVFMYLCIRMRLSLIYVHVHCPCVMKKRELLQYIKLLGTCSILGDNHSRKLTPPLLCVLRDDNEAVVRMYSMHLLVFTTENSCADRPKAHVQRT